MSHVYKSLVNDWCAKKMEEVSFLYEGDPISKTTLSALFYEQILKGALARLASCVGEGLSHNSGGFTNLEHYEKLAASIAPIYQQAVTPGFSKQPAEDDELDIIRSIPPETFSRWVVLALEMDVLPNRTQLEQVFVTEGF